MPHAEFNVLEDIITTSIFMAEEARYPQEVFGKQNHPFFIVTAFRPQIQQQILT
jgi:hypothetical protein